MTFGPVVCTPHPKPTQTQPQNKLWSIECEYWLPFFYTVNGTKSKTQDEPGMWRLVLWYVHHTLNLPKPNHKINCGPFFFTVNGTAKAKSKTQDEPGMWPLVLWYVHHTLNLPKPNYKMNYDL